MPSIMLSSTSTSLSPTTKVKAFIWEKIAADRLLVQ
jgi:hypothetical protein